ncbi:hypothetical protein N3K63_01135 [Microbacterium sp. W1N]|uniref:hypothetical protein n=1 Tax=Microbacterium festucae TaxID=2977531 RepID=UPI0021C23D5B|nr:hypothetical protein [Microbacterium festucae]MCT9818882.1 hypothetical protein [Microbacterium festucae]
MTMMPPSPRGRAITGLDGDGATIRRRGSRIQSIGRQMVSSADVLEDLVDDPQQRGKAIDKVREIVGDTYEELRRAGRLYEPTGAVLVTYGHAVGSSQPLIQAAVDACAQAWRDFERAPGHVGGRLIVPTDPDAAEQAQEEDDRKEDLRGDWEAEAREFDRRVDTWEDAFDTAVAGIGDVLDGAIEDSPWDDLDGFIATAVSVLQVVGLIVGIAAIIIGGPIVALIGAVVGVLTLALTLYQFIRQDASGTDLALAIVGAIPFGSAGKLFQGSAGRIAFLGDMFSAFKPSTWSAAIGQGRTLSLVSAFSGGGARGFLAGTREFLTMSNPAGVGDVMTRLLFGKDTSGLEGMITAMSGGANGFCRTTTLSAAWQFAYTVVSGSWKVGDNIATWTGNKGSGPSGTMPWVGAVL